MPHTFYRCDWAHRPNSDPVVIFYDVDEAGDVPRIIDVFGDGRGIAQSLADYAGPENELAGINSFVEGSFFDAIKGMPIGAPDPTSDGSVTLLVVSGAEFEDTWRQHRKVQIP